MRVPFKQLLMPLDRMCLCLSFFLVLHYILVFFCVKLVFVKETFFPSYKLSCGLQLSYPKSNTVRKGWVLRQIGKLLVFVGLMGFITEQYINPTIKNSQHPLKGNPLYALERVLKLSIPTLYVWLCFFYCFFHLW
jgi:hypothetical protein